MSQGDLFGAAPKRVRCTVIGEAIRLDVTTSGAVYVGCAVAAPLEVMPLTGPVLRADPDAVLAYVRGNPQPVKLYTNWSPGHQDFVEVHPRDIAHVRLNGTDG